MKTSTPAPTRRATLRARFFAIGALGALVSGIAYTGHTAYRVATDSFVAPIILTPDNELVLQSKVKLSELSVEHARTQAEAEGIDADIAADDKAVTRLTSLRATAEKGLAWTSGVTVRQVSTGGQDLQTLANQNVLLQDMVKKQADLVRESKVNTEAGLIPRVDYAHETQALNQLQLALLENQRQRSQVQASTREAALQRNSLASADGAPPMPEALMREDQMVRIDLELLRAEADLRTKRAEQRILREKLAKLDELEEQFKSRPLFRAIDKRLDVAFVPYTQLEGVQAGAMVYDCTWGVFRCKSVGHVAEVVPGEVVLPDPWGNQARGQLAVLDLSQREAARAKTLRVRLIPGPGHSATGPAQQAVSVR
jgi:hypothetical protein